MSNTSRLWQEYLAHGRAEDCPVISAHAHYGPYMGIYFPGRGEAASMLKMMDRAGMVRAVCAPHAALVEPRRGHALMAEVIAQYPERFSGYWCINPNSRQPIATSIEEFGRATGFVGFKFLSDYHLQPITSPKYAPVLEYADGHHLPVLMHTWGRSPYDGPALWSELAERYPGATLIMGHSGYGEWDLALSVARKYDNVYLELCAAYHANGIIERMVKEVGSHKVLYGEDLPWFDPEYAIGCVLCAHIGDEDRHNILHRNAERIFGWGGR
ncbi:MAG: amidohydrolase family protein [Anaerolineae bacterium]